MASDRKTQKIGAKNAEQPHRIQKNHLTPPKNARKIYVGCLDPNINVSDIYEVFGGTKAAYLKENVPYKLVIEKGLLS